MELAAKDDKKHRFCSRRTFLFFFFLFLVVIGSSPLGWFPNLQSTDTSVSLYPHQIPYEPLPDDKNDTILPNIRRTRKLIFLLHIHKSGGSTMCGAASLNRLRVDKRHNCNVQADQRCCGLADTLEAQQRFAAKSFYRFVANEGDMYEAMDPEHYIYIVVLRKSRDRYLSHWKHVCRELQKSQREQAVLPEFAAWWQAQPDNWSFRKICGTRCQTVPKFQITREIFDYALNRLRLFDHILLLEHWETMYPAMAQSLGWKLSAPKVQNSAIMENMTYPAFDRNDWDPFMSVLDDALYEYGVARYRGIFDDTFAFSKKTTQMLELYFSGGSERGCENPCCADSCSKYR
jgi:hypothetical protein